jgi:hypothetical protein
LPGLAWHAIAYGTIDEPAKVARVELPGRTFVSFLLRTISQVPTVAVFPVAVAFSGEKKKELSFGMGWNCPPTLFVTTDSFEGNTQESGDLSLNLVKFLPDLDEFRAVHVSYVQ